MTGIDGPRIKPSFPQPEDVNEADAVTEVAVEDERDEEGDVRDDVSVQEATCLLYTSPSPRD